MQVLQRQLTHIFRATSELKDKLERLVQGLMDSLECEAASILVLDDENQKLILAATRGLHQEAVGLVQLDMKNSLAGFLASRAEPINIADAQLHPKNKYIPETGDEAFHAYLGVPVIHHREVLAVLVLQHSLAVPFSEEFESFLSTLGSAIADDLAQALATQSLKFLASSSERGARRPIKGLPGASGIGFGEVYVVYPLANLAAIPDHKIEDVEQEIETFNKAVALVRQDIKNIAKRLRKELNEEECALFDAYLMILESQSVIGDTQQRIEKGQWAQSALRDTIAHCTETFANMDDPYMRERSDDIRELGLRILSYLQEKTNRYDDIPDNAIVIGTDITASVLAEIPRGKLTGIVSTQGSRTSHAAILARAMGIPAVMGASMVPVHRVSGLSAIVDGHHGHVYFSPSQTVTEQYQLLFEREQALTEKISSLVNKPAVMADGEQATLYVNAGLTADYKGYMQHKADGIGLYRTELPFMVSDGFPSEAAQYQLYEDVLNTYAPLPVYLRTLDIGGDKELPYFPIVETNPFLGWRGIRITLDHPEIFVTQVRAMIRASEQHNNLRITLPMISDLPELNEALSLIHRVHEELLEEGCEVSMPQVGVMIEVPSAVYMAESLAKRVDFFSIGTNDLTQYLLAVDRNNARVAELYDSLHPAVVKAIRRVVFAGHAYDKPVGVCGEMAGDPAAALLLIGLGVNSLSMSTSSLLKIKWMLGHFDMNQARKIVDDVLELEGAAEVRDYLNQTLESAGLGSLLGSSDTDNADSITALR